MKRVAAFLVLAVFLSGCGDYSLQDQQNQWLQMQETAGQKAVEIGNYLEATQIANQVVATKVMISTQNAQYTQVANERATQEAATAEAQSTQFALSIQQTQDAMTVEKTKAAYQAELYRQNIQQEQSRIDSENQRRGMTLMLDILFGYAWKIVGILAVLVLLFLIAYGAVKKIQAAYLNSRRVVLPRSSQGLLPAFISENGSVFVPDKQFWHDSQIPAPPVNVQAAVVDGSIKVQGVAALGANGRPPSNASLVQNFSGTPVGDVSAPVQMPPVAPWELLASQWDHRNLVLGVGQDGKLIYANTDYNPHILAVGSTGSGKTTRMIRPVITQALLAGWSVIIIDRKGQHYEVFADHPNVTFVEPSSPEEITIYMKAVAQQIKDRNKRMGEDNAARWEDWQKEPQVLVVLDEISNNLYEIAEPRDRKAFWESIVVVANDSRSAGVRLVMGVQSLDRESYDMRVRRNSTPVAFRVGDAAAARVMGLPGAESLPVGQFITVTDGQLQRGVGFFPDDELIRGLIQSPVARLPENSWIWGEIESKPTEPYVDAEIRLLAEELRPHYTRMISEGLVNKSELCRVKGWNPVGNNWHKVCQAVKYLASSVEQVN